MRYAYLLDSCEVFSIKNVYQYSVKRQHKFSKWQVKLFLTK